MHTPVLALLLLTALIAWGLLLRSTRTTAAQAAAIAAQLAEVTAERAALRDALLAGSNTAYARGYTDAQTELNSRHAHELTVTRQRAYRDGWHAAMTIVPDAPDGSSWSLTA